MYLALNNDSTISFNININNNKFLFLVSEIRIL